MTCDKKDKIYTYVNKMLNIILAIATKVLVRSNLKMIIIIINNSNNNDNEYIDMAESGNNVYCSVIYKCFNFTRVPTDFQLNVVKIKLCGELCQNSDFLFRIVALVSKEGTG